MKYTAFVTREGKHWLASFPDAPGCQTFAASKAALAEAATEALEGWLEAHLDLGRIPQRPRTRRRPAGAVESLSVTVNPALAVALQLRWIRKAHGYTQSELAMRSGVTQQQIAKLERPGENPTIGTLTKVASALGVPLEVQLGHAQTRTRPTVTDPRPRAASPDRARATHARRATDGSVGRRA